LDQDADVDYVDASQLRGKIDHSTAGAQVIWRQMEGDPLTRIVAQALALCVVSHHSGLIDCVIGSGDRFGADGFMERIRKQSDRSHVDEVSERLPESIRSRIGELIGSPHLLPSIRSRISKIIECCRSKTDRKTEVRVQVSLLVRFLFSCLIDADRTDTAAFANVFVRITRGRQQPAKWTELIRKLEAKIDAFPVRYPIDESRAAISNTCRSRASEGTGIFSLSVPTGGGKTLASLRFALHHAERHKLERVFFVIPYTSIIDQNADVVRDILEDEGSRSTVVLEHHSNIAPEKQNWREKILTESWDAPIVFTTMVQFLESLYGSGTRGARRMHQLAKSVVVFDEIQSLPIKCVHLFNNAINFLTEQCGSTAVLCTATQPLLQSVNSEKGALRLEAEQELVSDVGALFRQLERVYVRDLTRPEMWSPDAVADLILDHVDAGSTLAITNTKAAARELFQQLSHRTQLPVVHLSTNMCPAHRRRLLRIIRRRLVKKRPIICVSTQLIEAGVDVDFGVVVRHLAGLDSIAQAAGRCNRNGERDVGSVFVVNPSNEPLRSLPEIKLGAEITLRLLNDFRDTPDEFDGSLISPKAMTRFYELYFHRRRGEMAYRVPASEIGHDDTILNLLANNKQAVEAHCDNGGAPESPFLHQAFMTAAKAFRVIDSPTRGVIVPYGREGRELEGRLFSQIELPELYRLLRLAQQFTVNVFENTYNELLAAGALRQVASDIDIVVVDARYYDPNLGLTTEPNTSLEFLNG
jgi:CRISPR-associated endonuclease/helicase Cas3